jgi:hypothetical protein
MVFWLVLKLEISYKVIISWRILVSLFRGIFWRLCFCMVKYLSIHNSSFCLKIFNVNGKAHTLLVIMLSCMDNEWLNVFFFILFFKCSKFYHSFWAMVIPFLDWRIPNAQFLLIDFMKCFEIFIACSLHYILKIRQHIWY